MSFLKDIITPQMSVILIAPCNVSAHAASIICKHGLKIPFSEEKMPEKLLNEQISKQVRELYDAQLVHPVEIFFFSKDESCLSCEDSRQLLE